MVKTTYVNMLEQSNLEEVLKRLQRLERNLDELILDIIDMLNEHEQEEAE